MNTPIEPEAALPPYLGPIAERLALEGVPVRAIARGLGQAAELVRGTLQNAAIHGTITDMPKDDWPGGVLRSERMPMIPPSISDDDLTFACRKIFRLSALEAGFLSVLIKHDRVSKAKLHHVIECRRAERNPAADSSDPVDQKMVDVMICKLRKRLLAVDSTLEITTVWGDGYYLSKPVRDRLFELFKGVDSVVKAGPTENPRSSSPTASSN